MLNDNALSTDAIDPDAPPRSLVIALRLVIAMVIAGGITVALVVIRHDDLIRVWAQGNPAVREVLAQRGLQAVKDGSITPPRFIPVGITEYVVLATLVCVLAVFLRNGFEWARIGITLLLFFTAVASFAGFRVGQPALFSVCTIVLMVMFVALMVPLWHPATSAYIHANIEDPLE
ncbi:hypothetical protein [Nocardioides sp. Kera G14]|uniref:hypothetical protein n=1 Tax=Nocardioides sp. Kera G14 TaxID=2884264 RepID=UPI001D11D21C|nr:hypothetical protein [Nocardioides sp. Kera G14]UDY22500.1 hypothetical protein LH076_10455 [Nocardioides sp. Kera G14]